MLNVPRILGLLGCAAVLSACGGGGTNSDADAGAADLLLLDAVPDSPDAGPPAPLLGPCRMLPPDSVWNTDISAAPVHPNSVAYVAAIGAAVGLHADFGTTWQGAPNGIPYTLVSATQPLVPVTFTWADESDPGPYPIPVDPLIEGGSAGDGDRHVLVLETGSCTLYELYRAFPAAAGGWTADSGAVWHLDRVEQRPDGWTSADAAGLPILPGLVRYDEAVEQGEIRHALRVTVQAAQSAYIYPATHSDGVAGADPNYPPMGLRLRLRADFDWSTFSAPIQAILRALQTYGLIVADTGGDWYVSGAPDARWDDTMLHDELLRVVGADFEAVYTGSIHPY